jgi:PadR family transcriptional regulator, regulatory protein PadR
VVNTIHKTGKLNKRNPEEAGITFQSSAFLKDFSRFYILLLLFEGQKHGYQIMSSIEERLGQTTSPSLVYPFLRTLEEQGLVKSQSENIGQKKRNIYTLTNSGKTLCHKLFKQFTTIVSSAIEGSMEVCAHCGCTVYKDAYFEKIDGRKTAFCCKYCADAYKRKR